MSPRPKRPRRISTPPAISGLKPYGGTAERGHIDKLFLHIEEYEVIRLCDYEGFTHSEAARAMDVSRPTLTRIYSRARAKVAEALVEGRQIVIEGGKIYFDSDWYRCRRCGSIFNHPDKGSDPSECPLCGSNKVVRHESAQPVIPVSSSRYSRLCICPSCGYEKDHEPGLPCKEETCPVCGHHLMRRNNLKAKGL